MDDIHTITFSRTAEFDLYLNLDCCGTEMYISVHGHDQTLKCRHNMHTYVNQSTEKRLNPGFVVVCIKLYELRNDATLFV